MADHGVNLIVGLDWTFGEMSHQTVALWPDREPWIVLTLY